MVTATISRVRLHDLARLGRSRTDHRPASGPPPGACASRRRVVTDALWHRQRLAAAPQSGQLAPRTCELVAAAIPALVKVPFGRKKNVREHVITGRGGARCGEVAVRPEPERPFGEVMQLTEFALGRDALDLDAAFAAFLQHAQERGFVRADEIDALRQEFELDEETLVAVRAALEETDVEIEEDASPELDLTPSTPTTTDSLQLFLNGIGRYKLLTADEEVGAAELDLTPSAPTTTDSLQLFLNGIGQYDL
ncbi:MAG: sigma-70 factor domain-containing protein, partial [Gaiellaceae bacterium]